MPLDDEDNPSLAAPPAASTSASRTTTPSLPTASDTPAAAALAATDDLTAEDLIEDEGAAAQDFRAFAASLGQKQSQQQQFRKTAGVSAQTIRRGEKDFESHGTRAQADALEQSRGAMRDVLSYERVHPASTKAGVNVARGWYFPGWWEGFVEEDEYRGGEGGRG